MREFWKEVLERLRQPSTYLGIVTAIGGGAGFGQPWSTLAVIAGLIGVLMPPVPPKTA